MKLYIKEGDGNYEYQKHPGATIKANHQDGRVTLHTVSIFIIKKCSFQITYWNNNIKISSWFLIRDVDLNQMMLWRSNIFEK